MNLPRQIRVLNRSEDPASQNSTSVVISSDSDPAEVSRAQPFQMCLPVNNSQGGQLVNL